MSLNAAQLPDLHGRRALVTGANSGIGFPTALGLARAGAAVTLACRNVELGLAAVRRIQHELPAASVSFAQLNLASLKSVASLAAGWDGPLHLLVNNAGVMAPRVWSQTEDGFELQFGTNHLGHFALTGQLLPSLLQAGDARVVTVSSLAHLSGGRELLFGNPRAGYSPRHAYSNSKLANLLFGLELQRRGGGKLSSTVAHPGLSSTNLFVSREGIDGNPVVRIGGRLLGRALFQSPAAGALPSLYAATVAEPGSYSGPQWPGEVRGKPGPARRSALAADIELSSQLWELSEEWTQVSYRW
jgi:NAD(P)-dependent dehydrogenase (short-subunit alcohol dehydrogenase family)